MSKTFTIVAERPINDEEWAVLEKRMKERGVRYARNNYITKIIKIIGEDELQDVVVYKHSREISKDIEIKIV